MFTYKGVSCDTLEELEQLRQASAAQDFSKLSTRNQFAEVDRLLDCGDFDRAEDLLSLMEPRSHQVARARLRSVETQRQQSEERLRLAQEDRNISDRLWWDTVHIPHGTRELDILATIGSARQRARKPL